MRALKYLAQFRVTSIAESAPYVDKLDTPDEVIKYWDTVIAPTLDLSKENLIVIPLNTKFVPIGWSLASMGTVNECTAHPRDIFRPVIAANAAAFVVMHNHPSGDASPSEMDRRFTHRIREGATIMQIAFFDHIIVGDRRFSFREAGLI
jgi:DNA repair protein RadC